MTIKDQISSAKAEKKLRNRQESKDSEPKTGKQARKQRQRTKNRQTDETNLKRPNASDEDQGGLAE